MAQIGIEQREERELLTRPNEPDARRREVNPRLSEEDFGRWEAYYRIIAVRGWEAEARDASTNTDNRKHAK